MSQGEFSERRARDSVEGAPVDGPSDAAVEEATGRGWEAWFSTLDAWGARERSHPEIARHLVDEHGVGGWWAQSVTVSYERARGLRQKHQKADGFSISASKTVAVAVEVLFEAFVDDGRRKEWLANASMTVRTVQPHRTVRFDWEDGSTRVNVGFTAKGESKATVALSHERLPDAEAAQEAKTLWRERLAALKALLEESPYT